MAETTANNRLTRLETRAEEYVKRNEIGPTLARIETKLDHMKWILAAVIAFLGAIAAGVIVALIMLVVQSS